MKSYSFEEGTWEDTIARVYDHLGIAVLITMGVLSRYK